MYYLYTSNKNKTTMEKTSTFKVTYEKDILVGEVKEEMYVIANDFNEAVEKANKVLKEYGHYTIYSIQFTGECYI